MKRSEAIANYADQIKKAMTDAYRSVLESDGKVQYQIYVWEDGEIRSLEGPQGDNGYLAPDDRLFYVETISCPCFDPWDQTDHSRPDDDAEADAERLQIIEYLVDEYEEDLPNKLDRIITEAELYETYMN